MNTARHPSAQPDARKVVSLNQYRPYYTATELITESRRYIEGPGSSLEEMILEVPDLLACVLDLIMTSYDYRNNKPTNIAKACRLLAAHAVIFGDKLEEVCQ